MGGKPLSTLGDKSFEELKQTNPHGAEYWSARDLQPQLGYSQWRRFEQAIERAVTSCKKSGNNPGHHFAGAGKMVDLGSGSNREVPDYHLSRFACYLIAQNGDPPGWNWMNVMPVVCWVAPVTRIKISEVCRVRNNHHLHH